IFSLLFVFSIIFFNTSLSAQTNKTNIGSGNWGDISWDPGGIPEEADPVNISNGSVTIPYGKTYEVGSLSIDGGGTLIVNGNLIIHGDLLMTNNSQGFEMGPNAAVIVYEDFETKNQVTL